MSFLAVTKHQAISYLREGGGYVDFTVQGILSVVAGEAWW